MIWYETIILNYFIFFPLIRYPDREAMVTDACVPLSRLSDLISLTRDALDKSWLPAPIIAHAGNSVSVILLLITNSMVLNIVMSV